MLLNYIKKEIDKMMVEMLDGTQNDWGWSKSSLGANAILAVSMAVCRAGAASMEMSGAETRALGARGVFHQISIYFQLLFH